MVLQIEEFEKWSNIYRTSTGHYLYPPVELACTVALVGKYRASAPAWERNNEIRFDNTFTPD